VTDNQKQLAVLHMGVTDYRSTWNLQRRLLELRVAGRIPDVLMLNEHTPVYTFGKSSDDNHLLANDSELLANHADVVHVDRGGDITYHGPGQLVGYPILDLNNYYNDVHRYLRDLEEVIVRSLNEFGIAARRDNDFTGVWVGNEKIAAIGVKVSHWVTMHGFALNVNTDLSYFDRIIPCGIFHRGVTSMQMLIGKQISIDEVSRSIVTRFGDVFGSEILSDSKDERIQSLRRLVGEPADCVS